MLEKIKKTDKILFVTLLILLLFYVVSFTKSCTSTDKREVVKSALINKKNISKINKFLLQYKGNILHLEKKDNIWYVNLFDDKTNGFSVTMPADSVRMENFLFDLESIQDMYKLSDNTTKDDAFGLTGQDAFTIRYFYDDTFNDIVFGNQDFTLSSRYIMSGKSAAVYEISNIFDKYLSTSVQTWAEPYIISQQILGPIKESDIQRVFVTYNNKTSQKDMNGSLLELRHGGFPTAATFDFSTFESPLMEIKLELGNKNIITLKIIHNDNAEEQEYNIVTEYFNNFTSKSYKTYSKISGWTYNKIIEIML